MCALRLLDDIVNTLCVLTIRRYIQGASTVELVNTFSDYLLFDDYWTSFIKYEYRRIDDRINVYKRGQFSGKIIKHYEVEYWKSNRNHFQKMKSPLFDFYNNYKIENV